MISRKLMEAGLQAKGFERNASGDHISFHYKVDGKYTSVITHISHSRRVREISRDLLLLMRRQLKLDRSQEVKDLVECPMSIEDYNQILSSKSII